MITTVENQNFGWAVACDGYWAAVGNPNSFRYDVLTESLKRTGSVTVYRYNINTDLHDEKAILHRPLTISESVLLTAESASYSSSFPIPYWILHTELTGTFPIYADKDLLVDAGAYYSASDDGYGWAIDLRDTVLAVGCPYFDSRFHFDSESFAFSLPGYVDIYELSTLDVDPYLERTSPVVIGTGSIGPYVSVDVYVPAYQNYSYLLLQSRDMTDLVPTWVGVNLIRVSNAGGTITMPTTFLSAVNLEFRGVGIVGVNPYLTTIHNPNNQVTESFGYAVSLNDEWLAVGSPYESGSRGGVFMFRKLDGNAESWSFWQSLKLPEDIVVGDRFGSAVGMNKCTGSWSASLVVGSRKPSSSRAYLYQFDNTNWSHSYTFAPDNTTIYPLPFYPTLPVMAPNYPNLADSFGYDVAMYKDTVVIGAPTDRDVYEYPGSSLYHQGAVYFYERCPNPNNFYIALKSYGNEKTTKNNFLGWSVSAHERYASVGCPKINALSMSICYLRGSIFQDHYCSDNSENLLDGQFILYNKITSSIPDTAGVGWDITNVYQVKKRLLQPYRVYGWDTDICHQFVTVGAPMLMSGSYEVMDFNATTGSFTGSFDQLGSLTGKAYIYNLKNLREQFYVGNVFYRNGKIVIMTSGSSFEGVQNALGSEVYEYDINFKSKQLIFEKQVVCPIDVGEFNVSTNPTAVTKPSALFDVNGNGSFDFQDCDILLRYMKFKATEATGVPRTDWSASIINTTTDEEITVYNMYSSSWDPYVTATLFTASYSAINNGLFVDLDFNEDNKIDNNDMNILWKYFICRLTQKNYETYVTPNSQKKHLSDILDFLNSKTLKGQAPTISTQFLDYTANTKADPTGSYLAPYATQIGLYNGCDLVAVAKLGSPIKITPDFPINFIVKMDF